MSKEEHFLSYEKSEIDKLLIDECERLSIENDEIYFLFDTKLSSFINKRNAKSKEDKRDNVISELLENSHYHIGTELDFKEMPSRFSYYDTETKLTCRYEKYKLVVDFLNSLGFQPSETNLGQEMEQSFILECDNSLKIIIRIQPNLLLKIITQNEGGINTVYNGFFSKAKIYESFTKESNNELKVTIRDSKIKNILS